MVSDLLLVRCRYAKFESTFFQPFCSFLSKGWRKNMEDAHIALADLKSHVDSDAVNNAISIFGVFDGHGGI